MRKLVERVEVKATTGEKARYQEAAARRGLSLSDWARRGLDAIAEDELGRDDAPRLPSAEDVATARGARGALKGRGFGERVRKARGPWTV